MHHPRARAESRASAAEVLKVGDFFFPGAESPLFFFFFLRLGICLVLVDFYRQREIGKIR